MKNKKSGFIVTAELVFIATILVIGMLVGLVVVRDSVVAEMEDIAESIGDMDQSWACDAVQAQNLSLGGVDILAYTAGGAWQDVEDFDAGDDVAGAPDSVIFPDVVVPAEGGNEFQDIPEDAT